MNFLTFLEANTLAFGLSIFDRQSPLKSKIIAVIAILYFLSPFDIVPDFIPLAGWLDDLIIVPLAIGTASNYIPREVWEQAMTKAEHVVKRIHYALLAGLVLIVIGVGVLVYSIYN
jgi:uncharacterized membrane protein YkvA (DUF1232 family)